MNCIRSLLNEMAAAQACISMMDQGEEEASTPNGSLAAGLLLGVEGHSVSDMQPLLLHAHPPPNIDPY